MDHTSAKPVSNTVQSPASSAQSLHSAPGRFCLGASLATTGSRGLPRRLGGVVLTTPAVQSEAAERLTLASTDAKHAFCLVLLFCAVCAISPRGTMRKNRLQQPACITVNGTGSPPPDGAAELCTISMTILSLAQQRALLMERSP
ncbi:hypothetical protein B0J15DRAFT_458719 [Fusarium solani]|uniref:Uncharacterized protein n=1 Tax=Fusarium solani TaxID=169388 RepID=A0A9P9L3M3_FUSSL|nr:uncharacterized protein B0J15DRAFT_458719 [Fusarium solani]KAH7273614.1 hypothetical protein B0J15DRAFT_458719 [Fusarium solani]